MYISGRDRSYRPIVIINSIKLLNMSPLPTTEEVCTATCIIFEYLGKVMFIPGIIENLILIVDNKGVNVFTMPYSLVRGIISCISSLYKGKGRANFLLNAPMSFSIVWNATKGFLDEAT